MAKNVKSTAVAKEPVPTAKTKKSKAAAESNGHAAAAKPAAVKTDRGGLTKPQARLLASLCASKSPLNAQQLAEKANVTKSWVVGFVFKACAANKGPSLVELGLAKAKEVDISGRKERAYEATAAGRKLAEKITKG